MLAPPTVAAVLLGELPRHPASRTPLRTDAAASTRARCRLSLFVRMLCGVWRLLHALRGVWLSWISAVHDGLYRPCRFEARQRRQLSGAIAARPFDNRGSPTASPLGGLRHGRQPGRSSRSRRRASSQDICGQASRHGKGHSGGAWVPRSGANWRSRQRCDPDDRIRVHDPASVGEWFVALCAGAL